MKQEITDRELRSALIAATIAAVLALAAVIIESILNK